MEQKTTQQRLIFIHTRIRKMMFAMLYLLIAGATSTGFAQELIPFGPRFTQDNVRGNLTITANDIVGIVNKDGADLDPNAAYNAPFQANGEYITAYIDVDGDPSTFSSSSANLTVPDENCSRIVYAGLYWSANYYMARTRNPNNLDPALITANAIDDGNNTNTRTVLIVNNGPFAQQYTARYSQFSNDNSNIRFSPVTSYLVVAQPENGCNITNGAALSGNIAVIRKGGSCDFRQKVLNAQRAGAVGVVLVNDTNQLPKLEGNSGGGTINIPSVSVGRSIRDAQNDFNGDLINLLNNYNGVVLGTLSTTGGGQIIDLPATDPRKAGPADFRNIKFKTPAGGAYIDITADNVVWDGYANTATNTQTDVFDRDRDGDRAEFLANDEVQYVCYTDVTNLIDPANPFGTYTVADMNATQGWTSVGDGACGGWTLVVIYENLLESNKYISVQDGYVQIFPAATGAPAPQVDFNFSGFRTLPGSQPIDVTFGVAGLEGDKRWLNDQLLIERTPPGSNNYVALGAGFDNQNDINPITNFFNSSITVNNMFITPRNPASQNTMGFDSDLFVLGNDRNRLIGNNQTSANFQLRTGGDRYSVFLGTFSVTVIEPELRIIKRVFDLSGTEITNGNVRLGDEIFYDLEIQNIGNEDLVNGTVLVTDILPANTDFINIEFVPPGVTFTEPTPGTVIFDIPADLVETSADGGNNDSPISIRFRAQLVSSCEELRDACSDIIQNSATATYTGVLSGNSGNTISSSTIDPACQTTGGEASNILVEVPPCSQDVTFCNNNLTLVAGTGYDRYTWTGPGIGTPIVQLTSSNPNANVLVVPNPQTGVYQVIKEDTNPADGTCMTLTELFDVEDFRDITNPILDFVNGDDVITTNCTGLEVPQILLCGDRTFDLSTSFSDTNLISISWQELVPSGSCVLDPNDSCSLLSVDCTNSNWVQLPNGDTANFTVEDAGDYRILAEFDGGCVLPFYFSVFKNNYQPLLSANPIECGNDGSVTVTNVPSNFGFSLNPNGPFTNTSGIFAISTPGDVDVYAKDLSFASGCTYQATINVPSFDPVFVATSINPSCINDDNGTGTGGIQINITGGTPRYQYTISGGGLTNPIVIPNSRANNGSYLQDNLLPGTYQVEMISNRPRPACIADTTVTINSATDIRGRATLIAPPTCDTQAIVEITVTPPGNYAYSNGNGSFQTSNRFQIDPTVTPGPNYTFFVSDRSIPSGTPACIIEVPFNAVIPDYEPIVIDAVTPINPACPGDEARIQVDVSPSVTGREYTYELLTGTSATDTLYVNQQTIVSPLETITFTGVPDNDFYTVRVSHNNTTPPGTTPPTICPVLFGTFAVDTPDGIVADIEIIRPLTCNPGDAGNAAVRINSITGGSGNYAWSFNAASGYTNITSLPLTIDEFPNDGTYTIYVANQGSPITCPVSQQIDIEERLEPDSIVFANERDSDCVNQTITVDVSATPALTNADITNNNASYEFTITPAPATGPANFTINTPTGVQAITFTRGIPYSVTVVRNDNFNNNCEFTTSFIRDEIEEIDITSASQTRPVTCVGDTDGAFQFTVDVTQFASFSYEIFNQDPVANPTAVALAGPTTSTTSPVVINNTIIPAGIPAGTYWIRVTDPSTGSSPANACFSIESVVIDEPATPLSFTVDIDEADCGNNTGIITVTATGGRSNYQYELTGTASVAYNSNNTFASLAPGSYTVSVRDNGGIDPSCVVSQTITLDQTQVPTLALANGGDPCYDTTNLASQWIQIIPGGGGALTGPYEYSIDRGASQTVTFIGGTTDTFEVPNLTPGTYTVSVTNIASTCSADITVVINPELVITAGLTKELDCTPSPDATIVFNANGGDGTYTFDLIELTTGTGSQAGVTSPVSVPTAGTYRIDVRDGSTPNCIAQSREIIIQPVVDPLITSVDVENVECAGQDTGIVTINIDSSVGTGPFEYSIDNGVTWQSGSRFSGLTGAPSPGQTYNYSVRDAKFCRTDGTINVLAPQPINATIDAEETSCSGSTFMYGSVNVANTTGGTITGTGYTYTLFFSNGTIVPTGTGAGFTTTANPTITTADNVEFEFDGLNFGSYYATVTDENGCVFTTAIDAVQSPPNGIDIEIGAVTADCTVSGALFDIFILNGSRDFEIRVVGIPGLDNFIQTNGTVTSTTFPPGFVLDNTPPAGGNVHQYPAGTFTYGTPYIIEIRDSGNCIYRETITTPPAPNGITASATTSDVLCTGDSTGEVNYNVSNFGGTGIEWDVFNRDTGAPIPSLDGSSAGSAPNTGTINNFPFGRYNIVFTDPSEPFCAVTVQVDINEPSDLELEPGGVLPQLCDIGGSPRLGSITVIARGGTPPYTYGTNPTPTGPYLNTTGTLNFVAGSYDIYVRDANGCIQGPINQTIDLIDSPTFTTTPIPVFDDCTFSGIYSFTVTADKDTSVGQLQFGIDDGNGSLPNYQPDSDNDDAFTFTLGAVNTVTTYIYYVRDENGCFDTGTYTVYPELNVTATATEPTCRDDDATITATISGGSEVFTNLTFRLLDNVGTAIGIAQNPSPATFEVTFGNNTPGAGLAPGTYTVEVTDSGVGTAPGCMDTFEITIEGFTDPVATAVGTDVSCNGGDDGIITVTLDPSTTLNPDTPYTYTIHTADGAPGISTPVLAGPQTSPIFNNSIIPLPAGNYDIVITSDKGCTTVLDDITIGEPNELVATTAQSGFSCTTGTNNPVFSVITVTIEEGTAPYNVSYTGPGGISGNEINITDEDATATGVQFTLEAPIDGGYDFTVTDSNGCVTNPAITTETIAPLPILEDPTFVVDRSTSCNTSLPEQVTVTAVGGTGDFTFTLLDNTGVVLLTQNEPAGTLTSQFTFPLVTNAGDVFELAVTDDATGCTESIFHTIAPFDFINITAVEQTPENCFNQMDGRATLTITDYEGGFDYTIVDQSGTIVYNSVTSGTTLATDGNIATTSEDFIVPPTTGTGLGVGTYTINVQENDFPECTAATTVSISGPDRPLEIILFTINDQEFCDPNNNGAVQATATGIQGVATYMISPAPSVGSATNSTGLFTDLSAGLYTISVTDVLSSGVTCSPVTETFEVLPPTDDVAITATPTPISCFREQDGSISATATATDVDPINTPIQYTITPVGGTESARVDSGNFGGLAAGDYIITAYDNFNCSAATAPIQIIEPAEPTVAIDAISLLDCGDTQATITISGTADASLGRTVATYFAVDSNDNPVANNTTGNFTLGVGEYRFYIEDNTGCRSPFSNPVPVILLEDITFELDLVQAVINCRDEATGSVDLLRVNGQTRLSGGFGTYNFRLVNNSTGQFWPGPTLTDTRDAPYPVDGVDVPPSFFNGLPPGDYTYYVSTDRSCEEDFSFNIANPPLFERIEPEVTNVLCFGESNGQIRVFAQGGTRPYSFAISSQPNVNFSDDSDGINGEHVFTMLAPNDPTTPYEVQVQDANGCSEVFEINILEPTEIMAGIVGTVMPETCAGDMDGSVTVEISGGTAPYEFNITNEDSDFQPVVDPTNLFIDNLPGGQTIVFIRDVNDCRIELPVEVLPGVDINGNLQPDRDCPIFDPVTGVEIQALTYYVDFDAFGTDVLDNNVDILYILEAVDPANPAPIQSANDPRRYIVQPGIEYQGRMLHSRGCERDLGVITVDEYIPLTNLRAEMTGNTSDPNEYELFIDGGADGNSDDYTYIVIRLDNVRLDDSDTVIQDAITNLTNEDFEDGLLEENIFVIRRTGQYYVQVIDNVGCEFTAVVPLTYINLRVPNYFTPGKDDPNTPDFEDYWYPRQITPDQDPNTPETFFFENMEVRVFDRYGRLLAEFKGFQRGWDGIYKGQELPSGDYWYTVILNDAENKEFTGHFTLYR
ncbi:T9SS type B sorting domain-containing protein [Aquimarina sp. ERC-38]|uniref:T9SS type B sorting domain-containing protein n=1 Tax=Aquimarina sp. ERC-38 TaxID=2949996 RepID=UPI0022476AB4|nr:T9SS type B sorting domain-containing protein [Aquimarina sp. ERC-38]UZO81847.1 T9SS type B sorting domain-containing protein [Aquimarina sp. ERC-38]